ncbi:hypothetical protein FRACYDRAFT_263666 [Fragilariopsis cylindrus CCMP1102]|uniref:Uncharacterized protein n=1 Tax=Fragilariopsis cylindrus CCMP1102 TaxID=635003 RepID=A0A1E7EY02_9STRA|nr:hypothetical protein FRACYDRAFT_263666 [Fragilariopsis cylindrus CCMP1102]|eukprot:OEU10699.1 hypothetical protein FRACYDRAFT_263666 [Fragilariopsis cylindrus CCMP1102]
MAQGNGKLGKASSSRVKSVGSQRRKSGRTAKKTHKGSSKIETKDKGIVSATKQINRKNERLIAAKATNAHTKFYLNDLSTKGKNENQRQTAVRNKRQGKASKLSDRLRVQIDKLGVAKSKF